jgi:Zn finger protein HypA/HybF involved in hydrogenase expression
MLLHAGESRLRSAYAVLEGDSPEHAQGPGVLYLTTQRLVFETAHPKGPMRRLVRGTESRTVLDASLAMVRNVEVRRPRLGRERLVVELTVGRPAFDVLEPDAWAAAIALAKRSAPAPGTPFPTHIIERQVVKIRCRYCGSLGNEVDGRCPNCGAPL